MTDQNWPQPLARTQAHLAKLSEEQLRSTIDTPISFDTGKEGGDPRIGGFLTLASWAGASLGGLAALVTAFFTQGPLLWGFLGVFAISVLYIVFEFTQNAKHAKPWYAGSQATAGAFLVGHPGLFEPGTSILPAGMLVTFDHGLAGDGARLMKLQEQLQEFHEDQESAPDELREFVAWIDGGILNATFRRRLLPESFTGNRATWLISFGMAQSAMPHGRVDRSLWPVYGRPEHNEAIVLVPHTVWNQEGPNQNPATRGVSA